MAKAAIQPKKALKRKLTKQEKKFIEIKAKTGNGTLAVQEAFGIEDPNYASVKAVRLLGNDRIVNALEKALPDDLLIKVHQEGLNAIFTDKYNYNAPDYAVRHKYLDSAYKLKGSYAAEKHINVEFQVSVEERNKIIGISAEVLNKVAHEEING